jgi:hypothetical protein
MWWNPKVVVQFIDQEIYRLAEHDPPSLRSHLADCAKHLFTGQISIEEATLAFCASPPAASLILEIQQMLDMGNTPLPNFPSARRSSRKSDPWTAAEDIRLLVAVARFGAHDWRWISTFVNAGAVRWTLLFHTARGTLKRTERW